MSKKVLFVSRSIVGAIARFQCMKVIIAINNNFYKTLSNHNRLIVVQTTSDSSTFGTSEREREAVRWTKIEHRERAANNI
jgi:hypothetical protein